MRYLMYLGWVLFIISLWFNCTNNNKTTTIIKTREIKGSFDPVTNIVHKPIIRVVEKVSKSTDLELYNENEALKQAYFNETDSLKRELMYLKAVKLNEFSREFDNDTINITVKGIVQGEVKSLQPFYTIKERKENISIPVVKYCFITGFGISTDLELKKPTLNAGFGVVNKKSNIIIINFNTEKQFGISFYKKLF